MLIGVCSITPDEYGESGYGIGHDEDLLYHDKEDMKWFKDTTLYGTVAMGSITQKQVGFLKERQNIILSKNWGMLASTQKKIYADTNTLFDIIANPTRYRFPVWGSFESLEKSYATYIIGGESIFKALNPCITMYKVDQFRENPETSPNKFVNLDNFIEIGSTPYSAFDSKLLITSDHYYDTGGFTIFERVYYDLKEQFDESIRILKELIKNTENNAKINESVTKIIRALNTDSIYECKKVDTSITSTRELYMVLGDIIFAYLKYIKDSICDSMPLSIQQKLFRAFSSSLSYVLSTYQPTYDNIVMRFR